MSKWILTIPVLVGALFFSSAASAAVSGDSLCAGTETYQWMGDSTAKLVSIPSLTQPYGVASYQGAVLRPADTTTYPGKRPVVLLAHGSGGNKCSLFWAAQDLAGHGYIAVVWTAPGDDEASRFVSGVDAQRSAVQFVRSALNPYLESSDGQDIALAGWSLGSAVTAVAQADPDPGVKAAVEFDHLHEYIGGGEVASGTNNCLAPPGQRATPRVPALGFAMDNPCAANPTYKPADLKLGGFRLWRDSGVPAAELVMRGFVHTDFAEAGSETQHEDVSHFMLGWLGRYLLGQQSSMSDFFGQAVNGRPVADVLSSQFVSGGFIPDRGVNTEDFSGLLTAGVPDVVAPDSSPPKIRKGRGSRKRVQESRLKRHHLEFRFRSDEAGVIFKCRIDRRNWRVCHSPFVLKSARPGKHVLKVKARYRTGEASSTLSWHFRILRDPAGH